MANTFWARLAVSGLALGVAGCANGAPTVLQAPADPVNPLRAVQATENTLSPDALRTVLPERIPVSEVNRLVQIDPSRIFQADSSSERSIQQRGRGGGAGWRGGGGWRGGWGGRGWRGGYRGYGWRGYGGYGYYPYVSYYYPYGGYYYPYYLYGGYYYPSYYGYAGSYYYPALYPFAGNYYPYMYNWY